MSALSGTVAILMDIIFHYDLWRAYDNDGLNFQSNAFEIDYLTIEDDYPVTFRYGNRQFILSDDLTDALQESGDPLLLDDCLHMLDVCIASIYSMPAVIAVDEYGEGDDFHSTKRRGGETEEEGL